MAGIAEPGAVLLAGGRSTRMGRDKAALGWHGSTVAYRVAALLRRAVAGPVVVVAAAAQELPELPPGVEVVRDGVADGGPPAALARGLAALAGRADAAFATAVDAPLVHPALVRRVLALLGDADCAMPVLDGHRQPLAAAYRTRVLRLVAEGRLPPLFRIADRVPSRLVEAAELLADPALAAVPDALAAIRGLNTPAAFAAALAAAEPEVAVAGRGPVHAATVGRLLDALGLPPATAVEVDGAGRVAEPRFPLVAGDRVRVSARPA